MFQTSSEYRSTFTICWLHDDYTRCTILDFQVMLELTQNVQSKKGENISGD